MSQLTLHCGLHKTGTTYIQRTMLANELLLLDNGVVYPDYMRLSDGSHHRISFELQNPDWSTGLSRYLDSVHDRDILISAEDFTRSFWHHPDTLSRVTEICNQTGRSLVILYYLRRQDELKESVFSQIAKDWYVGSIYDDNHYPLDFDILLQKIEKRLPSNARIIVRPYEPALWHDEDIIADFLNTIGLGNICSEFERVASQNVSAPRRVSLFLATIKKSILPHAGTSVNRLIASGVIADDGVRYVMPPEQRNAILTQYADSNRRLVDRYPGCGLESHLLEAEARGDWFEPEPLTETERKDAIEVLVSSSAEWLRRNLKQSLTE